MADDVTDPKTGQLIYPGFQRGPGLHNATSYQVSAIPFLTGNLQAPGFDGGAGSPIAPATEIHFPSVTSWVKIDNLDHLHELRVSFSENGSAASASFGGQFNLVQSATGSWNTTGQLAYKVRKVYLRSNHAAAALPLSSFGWINTHRAQPFGLCWFKLVRFVWRRIESKAVIFPF